ncbi:amino acid ABC transporter substrate-binding protein [Ruminococcaceae bacterium OttesenSCG-928-I18]|nr:amino acid ABC transporter substrate-binding protein [Ruminococcaceae bacterium OttesenSCG-928-I18]
MKKVLIALLALCVLALPLVGCAGGGESEAAPADAASTPAAAPAGSEATVGADDAYATSLADIEAKGELVIGLDDTFAPMGFRDEAGELVGFDIDLANAVCEVLGVTATFQPIDWNAKEMELETGNIDCIWNGMSATPERQESMSLSQTYLNNRIIVMTNEGVQIATKEDLANYKVGVQAASAALEAIQADPAYDSFSANVTEYPTYDEIILAMQSGREDCMVIDEVFGNYKNSQMDTPLQVADIDFGDDLYAIGFRKGDTELTDAVNDALNQLIENGRAGEISTEWFGEDIVMRPAGMASAEEESPASLEGESSSASESAVSEAASAA